MGNNAHLSLTLLLHVSACPECGGVHERLEFTPGEGPGPDFTHRGLCPAKGTEFWLDTQSVSGVWDRLLRAAGVEDA